MSRTPRGVAGPGHRGAVLALLFLSVTSGYPLAILFLQSLFPQALAGRWDGFLAPYRALSQTPGLGSMIRLSLTWAGATTMLSWALGIPCGFLLARFSFPGRDAARLSLLAPVMTPPYIAALAYILILQPGGFGDQWVGVPEMLRSAFFSIHGVTLVMALSSFGYVALGVESALLRLSARAENAARQLGAGSTRIWLSILIPLLLPAIAQTGMLVFLDTLSNFGVPVMLGTRAGLALLPAEIFHLLTSWPINIPLATALSSLLCLLALASVFVSRRLSRGAVGTGRASAAARCMRLPPGRALLAWVWFGLLFVLSTALPYAAMIAMSLIRRWGGGRPEWTFHHYAHIFIRGSDGWQALSTSLRLSLAAATIAVVAGGFIAYVAAHARPRVRGAIDTMAAIPRVLPKIAMAVALILAWNAPWVRAPVYGTIGMLLLAYVAIYLSDALAFGSAAMSRLPPRLETAAAQLGAARPRIFLWIALPHIAPAMGAAWITTFIVCMRELVASLLLRPAGVETTATFVFHQFEQGDLSSAMAMATLTIGLTTGVLLAFQGLRGYLSAGIRENR